MQMLVIEMMNIFRKHYRDKEIFLTPYVIRFGKKGHHVYELKCMYLLSPAKTPDCQISLRLRNKPKRTYRKTSM